MKKKINKFNVVKFLLNMVFVLLLAIGVFVVVSILPIKNNYKFLVVTSGSMEPTIKTGSIVFVQPAKEYIIDDIVTFKALPDQSDSTSTTHRITKIDTDEDNVKTFTTKGDANKSTDISPVYENQIVGKYRFSVLYIGYVLAYIKTLPGLVLIIIIPATIIIYKEIENIKKEISKRKNIK